MFLSGQEHEIYIRKGLVQKNKMTLGIQVQQKVTQRGLGDLKISGTVGEMSSRLGSTAVCTVLLKNARGWKIDMKLQKSFKTSAEKFHSNMTLIINKNKQNTSNI